MSGTQDFHCIAFRKTWGRSIKVSILDPGSVGAPSESEEESKRRRVRGVFHIGKAQEEGIRCQWEAFRKNFRKGC